MSRRHGAPLARALLHRTLVFCALAGCALPRAAAPDEAAAPDDWRSLVFAPFGSALQDLHVETQELFLFQDAAAPGAHADDECYALAATRRRFLGRPVESQAFCLRRDRLARVDVVVVLPPERAARLFAAYCARWLAGTTPAVHSGTHCAGSDDRLSFDAELFATAPPRAARLALVVAAASTPSSAE